MLKNNYSLPLIELKFISYFKFSFKNIRQSSKQFNSLIILFWILKRRGLILNLKFVGLKSYSKRFTIMTSPKCFKAGKTHFSLKYYNFSILIKKILLNNTINNYFNYFKFYLNLFKMIDTNYIINNKIKFTKTINYNL